MLQGFWRRHRSSGAADGDSVLLTVPFDSLWVTTLDGLKGLHAADSEANERLYLERRGGADTIVGVLGSVRDSLRATVLRAFRRYNARVAASAVEYEWT